jgi:biuret amidohydrolase
VNAFAIVGVATEIGIEPTVRHGVDLGYVPIVVRDACGAGHRDAAERAIATLEYLGDTLFTNVAELGRLLRRPGTVSEFADKDHERHGASENR